MLQCRILNSKEIYTNLDEYVHINQKGDMPH